MPAAANGFLLGPVNLFSLHVCICNANTKLRAQEHGHTFLSYFQIHQGPQLVKQRDHESMSVERPSQSPNAMTTTGMNGSTIFHFRSFALILFLVSMLRIFLTSCPIPAGHQSFVKEIVKSAIPGGISGIIKKKNILLTGYICPNCDDATLESISAYSSCAARALNLELHQVLRLPDNTTASWPFPHYLKIYALDQLLVDDKDGSEQWVLWVDADVRLINLDYPLGKLFQYAEENNIHIITQTGSRGYGHVINNIFFIRNDLWGRRMMKVWKHLVKGGRSCGYYDQCPFGMALVQVALDYLKLAHSDDILSLLHNQPIEEGLKRTAWTGEKHELYDRLAVMACGGPCQLEDQDGIIKMGPVLRIPSWAPANLSHILPSSLSLEDGYTHQFLDEPNTTWPLGIHSKYSRLFCRKMGRATQTERSRFDALFRSQLDVKCTQEERENMSKAGSPCWATYNLASTS